MLNNDLQLDLVALYLHITLLDKNKNCIDVFSMLGTDFILLLAEIIFQLWLFK